MTTDDAQDARLDRLDARLRIVEEVVVELYKCVFWQCSERII